MSPADDLCQGKKREKEDRKGSEERQGFAAKHDMVNGKKERFSSQKLVVHHHILPITCQRVAQQREKNEQIDQLSKGKKAEQGERKGRKNI